MFPEDYLGRCPWEHYNTHRLINQVSFIHWYFETEVIWSSCIEIYFIRQQNKSRIESEILPFQSVCPVNPIFNTVASSKWWFPYSLWMGWISTRLYFTKRCWAHGIDWPCKLSKYVSMFRNMGNYCGKHIKKWWSVPLYVTRWFRKLNLENSISSIINMMANVQ